MAIAAGSIIAGRYEVVSFLGRGGVGEVYEALLLPTRQRVALKVLHAYIRQDEGIRKRFQREARAAGMIMSQHVAQVLDVRDDPSEGPVLVFELLLGETLHERLRREPRLLPSDCFTLVEQALKGLHDAHAAGVVHRDLKPANIFLQQRPGGFRVKILDFGISKLPLSAAVTPLTKPDHTIGSLSFMPPEQFEHAAQVDVRADIYSLATVGFRALSGALPYPSSTLAEMLIRKRNDPPLTLSAATQRPFDPNLEAWFQRAMARDPAARFPSAADALAAWRGLAHVLDDPPPVSRPPPSSSRGSPAPIAL